MRLKTYLELFGGLWKPKVSEPYYIDSDDWVTNACVKIDWYEHPFRARSSMLVLRKWENWLEVFMRYNKKSGEYNAPGGGWDKRESPKNAAIREAQEECSFNTKEVEHCGYLLEYSDIVQDWVKEHVPEKNWRYGYYSEVYVSQYDWEFNGDVDERDKDSIGYEWKWYPFDEIKNNISKEYKQYIEKYLKNKTWIWAEIKKSIWDRIKKTLDKIDENNLEKEKAEHEKYWGFPVEKRENARIEYHEFCDNDKWCPPALYCSEELKEKIISLYKKIRGEPEIVDPIWANQCNFILLNELPCAKLIINTIDKNNYEKYRKIPMSEWQTWDVSIDPEKTPHELICPNKVWEEIKRVYHKYVKDNKENNMDPFRTDGQKLYVMFINSPSSDIVRRFLNWPRGKPRLKNQ